MSSQLFCKGCDILLNTSLEMSDLFFLKAQLQSSQQILGNDGFALNVIRKDGSCPICGSQTNSSGKDIPSNFCRIGSNTIILPEHWRFLFMHTSNHFRSDLRKVMAGGSIKVSDRYLLAHRVLMHFSFAGSLSLFGSMIGCNALLNSSTSESVIRTLALLVEKKGAVDPSILENLPELGTGKIPNTTLADSTCVESFSIHNGSCIVVKTPSPKEFAEAYYVAIVVGVDLASGEIQEATGKNIPLLYFTLEVTDPYNGVPRTMVGEWKIDGSRRNYGYGPNPKIEEFVQVIERIWVSKIWI